MVRAKIHSIEEIEYCKDILYDFKGARSCQRLQNISQAFNRVLLQSSDLDLMNFFVMNNYIVFCLYLINKR